MMGATRSVIDRLMAASSSARRRASGSAATAWASARSVIGNGSSSPVIALSISCRSSSRLLPNTAYIVWTATPARSAIVWIVVAAYPVATKSSWAASRIDCRVSRAWASRLADEYDLLTDTWLEYQSNE